MQSSPYEEEDSLMIVVDGTPLDVMLSAASPEDQLEGLMPTLLPQMSDSDDRELVWSRVLPENSKRVRLPLLMCPEHLDLMCTIIVAEVCVMGDQIEWRRIGIDETPEEDLPELIGQDVYWFPNVGPFLFDRTEYTRMVAAFRQGLQRGNTLH